MAFTARESLNPLYRTVIEELRHERQETQVQLAARCHLSRAVISRLENGNGVGPQVAEALATAFDRDIRVLFTGSRALRKEDIPRRMRRHTSLADWRELLQREAVERPIIEARDVNLLLAPAGPAIVYLYTDANDWDATELRYAELTPGNQWKISRITNRVNSHSVYANFGVTPAGQVCGLFCPEGASPESRMVYGGRTDGGWSFHTVPDYIHGDNHMLRLDSKGQPHIVYNQNHFRREPGAPLIVPAKHTQSLLYLYYDPADGKWHTEAIDPTTTHVNLMVARGHFQLDRQDQPYVAYADYDLAGHAQLKLAHRAADGQWNVQTLWPPEGSAPENVELPGIVYTIAAVALDSQGQPAVLCLADTPRFVLLLLFRQVAGRWAFEKIPMAWQPGSPLICMYDQLDRLHIVVTSLQYDGDDDSRGPYFACDPTSTQTGGIFYLYQAADWVMERIAEEPYGADVAFALDEQGHPHVAFASYGHGGLWYATRNEPGIWERTRVDG